MLMRVRLPLWRHLVSHDNTWEVLLVGTVVPPKKARVFERL
jgi:hypothetical protein